MSPTAWRAVSQVTRPSKQQVKGTIVKGKVAEVDARGAIIELAEGIDGQLRASELSRDRVEDARTVLSVGDEVEARFVSIDRKNRVISLSIKAKEAHEEAEAVQNAPVPGAHGACRTIERRREHQEYQHVYEASQRVSRKLQTERRYLLLLVKDQTQMRCVDAGKRDTEQAPVA